jgi:alkyl sulfatase BDS1-like metallo-beta-lactamase superfamily hydrolase
MANSTILNKKDPADQQDFVDARRGFIAPLPNNGVIKNSKGSVVWDLSQYAFLEEESCPDTVTTSLWRQARLLYNAGLFKVTENIYQVRGADISNMTIIEGQNGITIVDPLLCKETAQLALALYYKHRPHKPISAVIYTHSHIDHFGGVAGLVSQADVDSGKIEIIAPQGFTKAALQENMLLGNVMSRRATYMYGNLLPKGHEGQVSSGLGLITSNGQTSLIAPTRTIKKTGEELIIDGITFVFLVAPHSEAPAEMFFFLPQFRALNIAEDATHTMHNIYTLRGAKIRDAKLWAHYLNQALELFGDKIDVVFAQHTWPIWGNNRLISFIEKQRDMYKYLHDQTVRLANQGYTMLEIGDMVALPKCLSQEWYNQGYYGSVNHNVKSIYAFYLGWFDGNPATLHPLPPLESSKKYVEYMGGSQAILCKAKEDYSAGNYRWVAQVLNHIIYAEPKNQQARELLADTFKKLAYETDNATWRNFYLTGAQELINGIDKNIPAPSTINFSILNAAPTELLLDYLAICIDGPKAADNPLCFSLIILDRQETYLIEVKNGVLHYTKNKNTKQTGATVNLSYKQLISLLCAKSGLQDFIVSQQLVVQDDRAIVELFLSLLDSFNFWFAIVEPNG